MEAKRISAIGLFVIGIAITIVGIGFDWKNFSELRRNQLKIEKTGIERCDTGVEIYPWIYMAFIILKMICAIPDTIFSGMSLSIGSNNLNNYDTWSLIITCFTSLFQCLDLLILVIFSFACLLPEGVNVFHNLISDLMNDFLSGLFGTTGLIINFTVKKNFSAVWKVLKSCTSKEQITATFRVFSVILLLLVFFCVVLAIILLRNYIAAWDMFEVPYLKQNKTGSRWYSLIINNYIGKTRRHKLLDWNEYMHCRKWSIIMLQ